MTKVKFLKDILIGKLLDDDLNTVIISNQERDNSYFYDLLYCGFRGYCNYSLKALKQELKERGMEYENNSD